MSRRRSNVRQYSAEDQALTAISNEAENRLAAKRAAREEAREIRMKEIERQQKEAEEKEKLGNDHGGSRARQQQATSSAGSRRGSDDSTENSSDTKDRDLKIELRKLEEKFKSAMMTSAQLDNEKQSLVYQVELLKDQLEEQAESHTELQREYKDKNRDLELTKRELQAAQIELKSLREQNDYKDRLIAESGLVIVAAEDGELALERSKDVPSTNGPMSTGGLLLSSESLDLLNKGREGSLGMHSLASSPPSSSHSTLSASSTGISYSANTSQPVPDELGSDSYDRSVTSENSTADPNFEGSSVDGLPFDDPVVENQTDTCSSSCLAGKGEVDTGAGTVCVLSAPSDAAVSHSLEDKPVHSSLHETEGEDLAFSDAIEEAESRGTKIEKPDVGISHEEKGTESTAESISGGMLALSHDQENTSCDNNRLNESSQMFNVEQNEKIHDISGNGKCDSSQTMPVGSALPDIPSVVITECSHSQSLNSQNSEDEGDEFFDAVSSPLPCLQSVEKTYDYDLVEGEKDKEESSLVSTEVAGKTPPEMSVEEVHTSSQSFELSKTEQIHSTSEEQDKFVEDEKSDCSVGTDMGIGKNDITGLTDRDEVGGDSDQKKCESVCPSIIDDILSGINDNIDHDPEVTHIQKSSQDGTDSGLGGGAFVASSGIDSPTNIDRSAGENENDMDAEEAAENCNKHELNDSPVVMVCDDEKNVKLNEENADTIELHETEAEAPADMQDLNSAELISVPEVSAVRETGVRMEVCEEPQCSAVADTDTGISVNEESVGKTVRDSDPGACVCDEGDGTNAESTDNKSQGMSVEAEIKAAVNTQEETTSDYEADIFKDTDEFVPVGSSDVVDVDSKDQREFELKKEETNEGMESLKLTTENEDEVKMAFSPERSEIEKDALLGETPESVHDKEDIQSVSACSDNVGLNVAASLESIEYLSMESDQDLCHRTNNTGTQAIDCDKITETEEMEKVQKTSKIAEKQIEENQISESQEDGAQKQDDNTRDTVVSDVEGRTAKSQSVDHEQEDSDEEESADTMFPIPDMKKPRHHNVSECGTSEGSEVCPDDEYNFDDIDEVLDDSSPQTSDGKETSLKTDKGDTVSFGSKDSGLQEGISSKDIDVNKEDSASYGSRDSGLQECISSKDHETKHGETTSLQSRDSGAGGEDSASLLNEDSNTLKTPLAGAEGGSRESLDLEAKLDKLVTQDTSTKETRSKEKQSNRKSKFKMFKKIFK